MISVQNFFYKPNLPDQPKKLNLARTGIAAFLAVDLLFLVVFLLIGAGNKSQTNVPSSNTEKNIEKASKNAQEASQAALEKQKPGNQLQYAYDAVVGADNLKTTLTLDENGIATIGYVITSYDAKTIIQTSLENFADLATKVFNIPTVTKLSVSSYAYKFTDSYGKANTVALKLGVSKENNSQINWAVKKYSYKDYQTILDVFQLNPQLQKDFNELIKKT